MNTVEMHTEAASRRFVVGTLLITLVGLVLRGYQISSQPVSMDDFQVALSSINYLESGQLGPTMWNHPNLRNFLVYFTTWIFAPGVLGVKGASLLFGSCCVPLVGLVARRLLRDDRVALTAALCFAAEPLAIDFSRQAINDIYLAFFPLLGIYLACRHRESGGTWWLLGAGASFGCGIASKWSGLLQLAAVCALLGIALLREAGVAPRQRLARLVLLLATLVVLPITIYLFTFLPWFGRGYTVSEWPALQQSMYRETSQHTGYHPLAEDNRDHWAWEWFVKPVTFVDTFFNLDGGTAGREPSLDNLTVLLAPANPLVWLLVYPALAWAAWCGFRRREEGYLFLAGLFLASYLPLALVARPIWLDTALSVLPYAAMLVASLVWGGAALLGRPRLAVGLYLLLVLVVDGACYPLVIGEGTRIGALRGYLRTHTPVEIGPR